MRWLAAAFAAAVCIAEGFALAEGRARPVVVMRERPEERGWTEGPADGVEPAFLAHMTPDDVARGVWGLADADGAVRLTDDQRAALATPVARGAELRERLGELRAARRKAEEAWLADAAALAAVDGVRSAR